MKCGFTIIEIIIVIIIVGVLAAVAITQYAGMVEKGRTSEAMQTLGDIRKFAGQYYFENNTLTGITDGDVNIGTSLDQIPQSCRSSHFYRYSLEGSGSGTNLYIYAHRCTAGGKEPQGCYYRIVWNGNVVTGAFDTRRCSPAGNTCCPPGFLVY